MAKSEEEEEMQDWIKEAMSLLKGKTIVIVRYMSKEEQEILGWSYRSVIIQLDDGTIFYPSRDGVGNEAGALIGSTSGGEQFDIPRM